MNRQKFFFYIIMLSLGTGTIQGQQTKIEPSTVHMGTEGIARENQLNKDNWGFENGGYQMSLHFEKSSFSNGEPVLAHVIVSNTTESVLYVGIVYSSPVSPISFTIFKEDGQTVSRLPYDHIQESMGSAKAVQISPHSQTEFHKNLGDIYDLRQPGNYTVCAIYKIQRGVEVFSGSAFIKIADGTNQSTSLSPIRTQIPAEIASKQLETVQNKTPQLSSAAPKTKIEVFDQGANAKTNDFTWRDKLLWGTLSFLFLVLAFVFYRAHRRSLRQNE